MKKALLTTLLLAAGYAGWAQLPSNSFAVTSACPASAANPSVLQQVNTDGSLTPIDTVRDGSTPLILNALGTDANTPGVVYGLSVQQPVTPANFNTPPTLYRVALGTAQATSLGTVAPPASPSDVSTQPQAGESGFYDARLTLNFIGDGDASSNYYVAGATFRVFYVFDLSLPAPFLRPVRVSDLRLYVGVVALPTFPATAPVWNRLNAADPATAALISSYQTEVQAYLNSNGTLPVPEGGIQDWVYDVRSGNLVSYIGQEDLFLTISTPATTPTGQTTQPAVPIPTQQNIGSMFTDRDGNIYAVDADGGTIYKIDRLSGSFSGSTYGSAFGCSRGDAVSLPGALPLPVTLTHFTARPSGSTVRLAWTTASEQHADAFLVQRSRSGTDWHTIRTVRAGNQPQGQAYAVTDAAPPAGTVYYRLGMRDTDGSTAYSPAQAVQLAGLPAPELYPNPAAGRFAVQLGAPAAAATELELLTATGQRVRRATVPAGSSSLLFETQGLPPGLYHLRVQQAGAASSRAVVLLPEGSR